MAVFKEIGDLTGKGYATMAKSTLVPFELPSEFSPDPMTDVIQAGSTFAEPSACGSDTLAVVEAVYHV
jgi:putative transposase